MSYGYSPLSLLNVFDLFYLLLSCLLLALIVFCVEVIYQRVDVIHEETTIRSKSKFIKDWNLKNDKLLDYFTYN